MTRTFVLRQASSAILAANAIRPVPGMPLSVPVFMSGWLTAELAPQLLALTATDSAIHVARHGIRSRSDKVGLLLSTAAVAALSSVIATGRGAAHECESALREELGEDYAERDGKIARAGLSAWRRIYDPFWMRRKGVTRVRNLRYAPGGRRFRLNIYHRDDVPSDAPVLFQIHGGGWVIGSKDQQGIPLMLEMASRGWVCVSINYPLSPRAVWPAHLIAAKQALAWVRANIGRYGGDPDFIAVTGGSAGGHLTAMMGLTPDAPELQPGFENTSTAVHACVPHYGVYDMAGDTGIKPVLQRVKSGLMPMVLGKNAKFPDDYRAASPLAHLRADAPPFFVLHGRSDSFIPVAEARVFVEKLREASDNPVAYAELRGAQHAFDVFPSIRSAAVVQAVGRFLEWAYRTRDQREPENRESVAEAVQLRDTDGG
ncbi:alpha/beta hydrolase fold domain-containing protein [Rhodococcus sp. NPDC058521]|uniref:alpha/beta hydrolase fold domain-containing protein n=1 Tax=Rhodococcus sp. NPDC058521 TaxID=3346536 RepID=UPI0036561913